MLNQPAGRPAPEDAVSPAGTYDLVVMGAGIAGLNALNSASEYLPKGARALLVDRKAAAGGMWTVAYDYLRLHQPHPMFTVGDMKWGWSKPPHYLASRDEVQTHLAACLDRIGNNLNLTQRFGHTVTSLAEVETPDGPKARVTFHPEGHPEKAQTVFAELAIEAEGLNYRAPDPLRLTSDKVVSIPPDALRATLANHPDAPVIVVGGGKTAMDTVIEVLDRSPDRKISLIVGRGTDFFNRTRHLPRGLQRWGKGRLLSQIFHEQALFFDGDNEAETAKLFRSKNVTGPGKKEQQFFYGIQSEEEFRRIESGVADRRHDYLEDIADGADGPVLILRGGDRIRVEEGSIVVNCTGNIFRFDEAAPARPCLSTNGRILSINVRDSIHFLGSVSGFFLPHLHYRGVLEDRGFYTLDMEALFRKDRTVWVAATATLAYLTQALAVKTLPLTLVGRCGLDLDRWYPLPRRLVALAQMKAGGARDIEHCQKALDRVAERFGVRCAPLAPRDRTEAGTPIA